MRGLRTLRWCYRTAHAALAILEQGIFQSLLFTHPSRFERNPIEDGVIVALTSFPARIGFAWIAIESILRQHRPPDRIILVLSEQEFENRKLPQKIVNQTFRGVELLWVTENTRSYKKLLPVSEQYPRATIITVDDDAIYRPWLVATIVKAHQENPDRIIGMRGWEYSWTANKLTPYLSWTKANQNTPQERIFLTGVGGVLYPPGKLKPGLLSDYSIARKLCPSNDDIWFWVVAKMSGVAIMCMGKSSHTLLVTYVDPENSLNHVNVMGGENDIQLAKTVAHFTISPDD